MKTVVKHVCLPPLQWTHVAQTHSSTHTEKSAVNPRGLTPTRVWHCIPVLIVIHWYQEWRTQPITLDEDEAVEIEEDEDDAVWTEDDESGAAELKDDEDEEAAEKDESVETEDEVHKDDEDEPAEEDEAVWTEDEVHKDDEEDDDEAVETENEEEEEVETVDEVHSADDNDEEEEKDDEESVIQVVLTFPFPPLAMMLSNYRRSESWQARQGCQELIFATAR